jgi:hypothetical protein
VSVIHGWSLAGENVLDPCFEKCPEALFGVEGGAKSATGLQMIHGLKRGKASTSPVIRREDPWQFTGVEAPLRLRHRKDTKIKDIAVHLLYRKRSSHASRV